MRCPQDEDVLRKHDYTEATESTVDVSMLPKVMQVKNFGKRGRTKYTHLLDQDTTVGSGGFGGTAPVKAGGTAVGPGAGAGCFLCGGPHLKKDCPQNKDLPPNKIGTGANASGATGVRQWGARRYRDDEKEKGSWRDRDGDGRDRRRSQEREQGRGDYGRDRDRDRHARDRYDRRDERDRDRYGDRDRDRRRRSYSRSRSPPRRERWRDRDEDRRRRERSLEGEHDAKRRRMD